VSQVPTTLLLSKAQYFGDTQWDDVTILMKVQNLQAGEEHGPCCNSICFIIFFSHFSKEHWAKNKYLHLWVNMIPRK
jgi:hypothetical protein